MIMCDNCGDKSAVYFVNDSELCEDCFEAYENCCVCQGLFLKASMTEVFSIYEGGVKMAHGLVCEGCHGC